MAASAAAVLHYKHYTRDTSRCCCCTLVGLSAQAALAALDDSLQAPPINRLNCVTAAMGACWSLVISCCSCCSCSSSCHSYCCCCHVCHQVTEESLAGFFAHCGTVMDCRICGDPNSAMRFAFIEFMEAAGAQQVRRRRRGCDGSCSAHCPHTPVRFAVSHRHRTQTHCHTQGHRTQHMHMHMHTLTLALCVVSLGHPRALCACLLEHPVGAMLASTCFVCLRVSVHDGHIF